MMGMAGFLPSIGLSGCTNESPADPDTGEGKPVPVIISLTPEEAAAPIAATGNGGDEIKTLNIYIVNATGKVEAHVDETDFTFNTAHNEGTTASTVKLQPGTKTVYAFANCEGDAFSTLSLSDDWATVPEAVSGNQPIDIIPINAGNGIPMSARTTWEVSESRTTYKVELIRMVAKMEITLKDQRESQSNKVTSLTLAQFQPDRTKLFRPNYGIVELPESPTLSWSDWKWVQENERTASPSIAPFYLHETKGSFTVSIAIDREASPRTAILNTTIPRNHFYPLTIYLTDYSLDIQGSYRLAAIGTVTVSKNIGNGYTIELPEGSSDVQISIGLKENGTLKSSDVTWTCSPAIDHFNYNTSGQNATLVLSSEAIPAIPAEHEIIVTATFLKNGKKETYSFDLTLLIRPLADDDLTKASPASPLRETQPISIEL